MSPPVHWFHDVAAKLIEQLRDGTSVQPSAAEETARYVEAIDDLRGGLGLPAGTDPVMAVALVLAERTEMQKQLEGVTWSR